MDSTWLMGYKRFHCSNPLTTSAHQLALQDTSFRHLLGQLTLHQRPNLHYCIMADFSINVFGTFTINYPGPHAAINPAAMPVPEAIPIPHQGLDPIAPIPAVDIPVPEALPNPQPNPHQARRIPRPAARPARRARRVARRGRRAPYFLCSGVKLICGPR